VPVVTSEKDADAPCKDPARDVFCVTAKLEKDPFEDIF